MLSKSKPRLITTGNFVPVGTNGGVSVLGLLASVGGGLFVGVAYWISAILFTNATLSQWPVILVGTFSGLIGSVVRTKYYNHHLILNAD